MRDTPEGAHLQLFDFVGTVDLALQAGLVAHCLGTVGQDGGGHAIARLVDQVASEVLRLANNAALLHRGIHRPLVRAFGSDDGQLFDLLFLAIALVVVRIEVADERAFHHRLRGIVNPARHDEREALQVFRLQGAHRRTGQLAQLSRREAVRLAAANQQQTLGVQPLRLVQQCDLQHLAGNFARGDEVGCGVLHSAVVGLDLRAMFFGFVAAIVVLGGVGHGHDQAFGFDLRRYSGIERSFHLALFHPLIEGRPFTA